MGKTTRLFDRCVRRAIKAASRVRDLYVGSLLESCGGLQYAASTGYGSFPSSYAFPMETTSSCCTREISRPCAESPGNRRAKGRAAPFSHGVVLETIDEEKPCEFGGDVRVRSGLLGTRNGFHAI